MKKTTLVSMIAMICAPALSQSEPLISPPGNLASVIEAGVGISYRAKIVISKKAVESTPSGMSVVLTTDDQLNDAAANNSEKIVVSKAASMSWSDPATNPDGNEHGFGWAHQSPWYLVDLNQLKDKKVNVRIKVERHDDGIPAEYSASGALLASDDDLIPGLTVWKGYQNVGSHISWFPSKHQQSTTPFWASSQFSSAKTGKLSLPVSGTSRQAYKLAGRLSGAVGYDTAGDVGGDVAVVEGAFKLDEHNKNNNYLTIALGGDARHDLNGGTRHSANYRLTIEVSK